MRDPIRYRSTFTGCRMETRSHRGSTYKRTNQHRTMAIKSRTKASLRVWHWNANGFQCRRAVLQQYIKSLERPPDVILVQETHAENAPSLPGYRAHASTPSARERCFCKIEDSRLLGCSILKCLKRMLLSSGNADEWVGTRTVWLPLLLTFLPCRSFSRFRGTSSIDGVIEHCCWALLTNEGIF